MLDDNFIYLLIPDWFGTQKMMSLKLNVMEKNSFQMCVCVCVYVYVYVYVQ